MILLTLAFLAVHVSVGALHKSIYDEALITFMAFTCTDETETEVGSFDI